MKKLLFFTVFSFALLYNSMQAQQPAAEAQIAYLQQFKFDKTTRYEDINLETLNFTGSPYVKDRFLAGEIYHNNRLIAENVPLRYNAFVDEIEFKPSFETPDSESGALMKSPEVDVQINSKFFVFVPYQGGIEKGGYFEVLLSGKRNDLFKKHKKRFTPEQKAQTSMTRDIPAKFTDHPVYYLVLHDGRFVEIPSRKRNFHNAFIGKEREIAHYIKENKLDVRNESHIIQIVNHYNSL